MQEKVVLCFGDSNTHGYNAGNRGRFAYTQRWTGVLQGALGTGHRVLEEGLGGRTTVFEDPINEGLCGLSMLHPLLKSHGPLDTLVIMLGTNDTKERFSANAQLIGMGLARLVQKAKMTPAWANENPDILLVAPVPIKKGYDKLACGPVMGAGCVEKSEALAAVFGAIAREQGCRFFDANSVADVHENDNMHLTSTGHAALGQALARLLQ